MNTMLIFASDINDYTFKGIYKAELEDNTVYIKAYAEYKYIYRVDWITIGRYDIESKEGKIILEGCTEYKWYKNLKSMLNVIYKVDNNACIDGYDKVLKQVKETKASVKQIIEQSYIVGNRAFKTIDEAKQYCDAVDFDYDMILA